MQKGKAIQILSSGRAIELGGFGSDAPTTVDSLADFNSMTKIPGRYLIKNGTITPTPTPPGSGNLTIFDHDFGSDTHNSGMFNPIKNGEEFILELDSTIGYPKDSLVSFTQSDYYKANGLALVLEDLGSGRHLFRMLSNGNYFHTKLIQDWFHKAPKPATGLSLGDVYNWDHANIPNWNPGDPAADFENNTIYALHLENYGNGQIWAYAVAEGYLQSSSHYLQFRIISLIVPKAWVQEAPELTSNAPAIPITEVNVATGEVKQMGNPLRYQQAFTVELVSPGDNVTEYGYRESVLDASITPQQMILINSYCQLIQHADATNTSNIVNSDTDAKAFIDEHGLGVFWYDGYPNEQRYTKIEVVIEFHKNEVLP